MKRKFTSADARRIMLDIYHDAFPCGVANKKTSRLYNIIYSGIYSGVGDKSETVVSVCLLQDIIKDTNVTAEKLRKHYKVPKKIVDAIVLLKPDKNLSYIDQFEAIRKNRVALKTKLATLLYDIQFANRKKMHSMAQDICFLLA